MTNSVYDQTLKHIHELNDLGNVTSLMHWDMEVMMPPKGATGRGEQLATMAAIGHRMSTDKKFGENLKSLSEDESLDAEQKSLIDVSLYRFERSQKLPEDFVREFTEVKTKSYHAWVEAREANDFSIFGPHLERLVDFSKRKAEYYGYEDSPYDALIENFERGMTSKKIEELFRPLAGRLSSMIGRIRSGNETKLSWHVGNWDRDAQFAATREIISAFGYDFEAGRMDLAPHPFCTNFDPADVRITSRFENNLFGLLSSSIHEAGHALYEQGMNPKWRRTPLCDAPGLGIHECNSRLWENIVAGSLPFWKWAGPVMQKHFPGKLDGRTPEDFLKAVTQVTPSLIRVESDEVTYNLHIIIRFEIEKALLEGELEAKDVPAKWNELYKSYLDIDVPDDANGCLQDIHWSEGYFGYFPTYTLGNLYSAQVMNQARQEIGDLDGKFERGEFLELREWLREKIHLVGYQKLAPEIMKDITGKEVEIDSFMEYLEAKYL